MLRLVPLLLLATMEAAAADLRLEVVRESLTGTHCRYREYLDGLPSDVYVVVPCTPPAVRQPVATAATDAEGLRVANGRIVRRQIIEERPFEPWAHDYDPATGALIRRIPLFYRAAAPAAVFDPNPVVVLNEPTLQDLNDSPAAVPLEAYSLVDLQGVADSGRLRGPHVTLVDRQAPHVDPPAVADSLLFDRSDDGFEDVNAYFHIDRNQRYLQSLGYRDTRAVVPYAIEVDAHAAGGNDNSFFIPFSTQPGFGALYFGEGGTDDAEDADLLIHEYMHAILEWIAPGTFSGPFAGQPRALSEGYGDYWAFSAHYAARLASGRDPFCLADWDARCWTDAPSERCAYPPGSDCLRRVDSPLTMADYRFTESAGVEHRNGSIWSSALREIHQEIVALRGVDEGRRVTDTMVIESLFGAPPQPSFAAMALRLIEADRLLYGGAHGPLICRAMSSRGIVAACGGIGLRGDVTLFQSREHGIAIPDLSSAGVIASLTITDSRPIEELYVRVDIAHPSRGDLRIDLIAPDGTTVLLHPVSTDRAADIRTTYGLTAAPAESLDVFRGRSAAGIWQLRVRDLRARDAGTLLSWGLLVRFAGDEPLASRPRAASAQMIPVVAHVLGVGLIRFVSDVRIANPNATRGTATLIFTPSGTDGTTSFSAIDAVIEPGETIAFDDVVASAFQTTGSGSLEVLGDVIVMSRTYSLTDGGTVGQQVPPGLEESGAGDPPLFAAAMPIAGDRLNLGITEVSGGSGEVAVEVAGAPTTLHVPPFSHLQIPIGSSLAAVRVIEGDARVVAYVSQVDSATGDAMFVPALRREERDVIAPAISAGGANAFWRSDLWLVVPQPAFPFGVLLEYITAGESVKNATHDEVQLDTVANDFGRPGTAGVIRFGSFGEAFAHSRITNGTTTQYVPFLPAAGGAQHVLFIENGGGYRTNIGIAAPAPAVAEAIVYDAAGDEVTRLLLATPGGIAQVRVPVMVTNGRAIVRFLSGEGRAYASLIDEQSGDATFVAGQ